MSTEWQPIETAPKDRPVLTFRGAGLMAVAENISDPASFPEASAKRIWCCTDGCYLINVTHWMPLPAPPVLAAGVEAAHKDGEAS